VFVRRNNQKRNDAPKKSRFADKMGRRLGEIGVVKFYRMAWFRR